MDNQKDTETLSFSGSKKDADRQASLNHVTESFPTQLTCDSVILSTSPVCTCLGSRQFKEVDTPKGVTSPQFQPILFH